MIRQGLSYACGVAVVSWGLAAARAAEPPRFEELFNGKDLSGWVNVNTAPDTWSVRDGVLLCTGRPIGVMRTEKQYENFILHVEWRHIEAGGNSGVFAWSDAPCPGQPPSGGWRCRCSSSTG